MARRLILLTAATVLAASCGGEAVDRSERGVDPPATTATTPTATTPTATTPTATTPTATTPPVTAPPTFESGVEAIADAARLPASWRPGCPVPIEELRLLTLDYWGFDDTEHRGELVVHAREADAVVGVFRTLFENRFPIERMELVDAFAGDDDASMAANNTSGFNCREVAESPGVWSLHAYGLAVDINPLVNPYVLGPDDVRPPEGAAYLERSQNAPGLIRNGDVVVSAFAAIGWEWGGAWASPDYQHFSFSGR